MTAYMGANSASETRSFIFTLSDPFLWGAFKFPVELPSVISVGNKVLHAGDSPTIVPADFLLARKDGYSEVVGMSFDSLSPDREYPFAGPAIEALNSWRVRFVRYTSENYHGFYGNDISEFSQIEVVWHKREKLHFAVGNEMFGSWYWYYEEDFIAAYKQGRCPVPVAFGICDIQDVCRNARAVFEMPADGEQVDFDVVEW